jgi:hypothetical protein
MQQNHSSLDAPLLPTAKVPGGPQSELPLPSIMRPRQDIDSLVLLAVFIIRTAARFCIHVLVCTRKQGMTPRLVRAMHAALVHSWCSRQLYQTK